MKKISAFIRKLIQILQVILDCFRIKKSWMSFRGHRTGLVFRFIVQHCLSIMSCPSTLNIEIWPLLSGSWICTVSRDINNPIKILTFTHNFTGIPLKNMNKLREKSKTTKNKKIVFHLNKKSPRMGRLMSANKKINPGSLSAKNWKNKTISFAPRTKS